MLNLTEEQKKRARPEAIRYLIKITEESIRNGYRPLNGSLEDDLKELKDLLEETEGRTQA